MTFGHYPIAANPFERGKDVGPFETKTMRADWKEMDKEHVIHLAVLATRAEGVMDEGQQASWDGKVAIKEALFALYDHAVCLAREGGYEKELERAVKER